MKTIVILNKTIVILNKTTVILNEVKNLYMLFLSISLLSLFTDSPVVKASGSVCRQ